MALSLQPHDPNLKALPVPESVQNSFLEALPTFSLSEMTHRRRGVCYKKKSVISAPLFWFPENVKPAFEQNIHTADMYPGRNQKTVWRPVPYDP